LTTAIMCRRASFSSNSIRPISAPISTSCNTTPIKRHSMRKSRGCFSRGRGLGFAVRAEPGMSVMPGSVGLYFWGGIAGTTFWIDPLEELYAMMLIQAPGQRDYYRALFRTLVYGALG
jgi:CubicO group peptidase (beta-lactamase class C family)